MDPKKNGPKVDVDYFSFINHEFYEWSAAAPTNNLVDAIREYFKVLDYNIKLIDEEADFTDPLFLDDLKGIAWNFYELGPWVMFIQNELHRRSVPMG
jgi:hypothetical protein